VYDVLKLKQKYQLSNDPAQGPNTKQLNQDISDILKPYGL